MIEMDDPTRFRHCETEENQHYVAFAEKSAQGALETSRPISSTK